MVDSFIALSIVLGILVAIFHYFSHLIYKMYKRQWRKYSALAAGISASYLFLFLLPEIFSLKAGSINTIFLFALLGFVSLVLVETHVYNHKSHKKMKKEMKEIHTIYFFCYHFIIGILIVSFLRGNIYNAALFLFAIIFQTAFSGISMKEVHDEIKKIKNMKIILSCSTLIGVIFELLYPLNFLYNLLLGFIIGSMIFIITNDTMPEEKKSPVFFMLGILIFTLFLFAVMVLGITFFIF